MKVLCVLGKHNYGDPKRGLSHEYSNFIPSLRQLVHDVAVFESRARDGYRSFSEMNRALLKAVEDERPEMVLFVLSHFEIWLETLQIIKDHCLAATVAWATDDTWQYPKLSRFVAPVVHAYATTYSSRLGDYQKDHITNVFLTQWGVNAALLQPPRPASECKWSVTFVGSSHGDRADRVRRLQAQGIHVDCFGYGWPAGPVDSQRIPEIIRDSVISLNFANGANVRKGFRRVRDQQIKARTFEVPGMGGFLLTEDAPGLDSFYIPGVEIAVYNDFTQLAHQIQYYLSNPERRDQVARAGFERTYREHTYSARLRDLIDFTMERFRDEDGLSTAPRCVPWAHLADLERQHSVPYSLNAARIVLARACTMLWGPKRGPRAARRLVYELSWRAKGAHTYSAAGLPGRLFYSES